MRHTAGKKKAFTEMQGGGKREILLKLQRRDDVNSGLETHFQNMRVEKKTVKKAALKTPTCPSYMQSLKGWRHPTEVPADYRFDVI